MNDTDFDLDLHAAANRLDVPVGDVDQVVTRAERRQARQRVIVSMVTVVALITGSVTAFDLPNRDRGRTPLATASAAVRGDVGLTWKRTAPASGLGWMGQVRNGTPLYALSTAPGATDVNRAKPHRVVWASTDGVEWAARQTLADDLYLSDLSPRGDRIYAVGTAPAQSVSATGGSFSNPLTGWSDDGGKTWRTALLPFDLGGLSTKMKPVVAYQMRVAAGPKGTVAAFVLGGQLDVPSVLPPGVEAPNGWALSPTGVDVLKSGKPTCPAGMTAPPDDASAAANRRRSAPEEAYGQECVGKDGSTQYRTAREAFGVAASYTWADLHIDGDLLKAVRREAVAFFAPPGTTRFERVNLAGGLSVAGALLLKADDDGFDLAAMSGFNATHTTEVTTLRSTDGRTWQPAGPSIPGSAYPVAVGQLGGATAVVISESDKDVKLYRADGAGGWITTSLTTLLDPSALGSASLVPFGGDIGPLGVAVAVLGAPPNQASGKDANIQYRRVLVSRDGATWADYDLDALAGERVIGVSRVAVTGDRALVTVGVAPREKGRIMSQLVLSATAS